MPRADDGLAFMLQYENVAWYQDGAVRILDRRVYPRAIEFVICMDYIEVAQAIADMVTQSGGPWLAAQQAMVMTAYQVQGQPMEQAKATLREAAYAVTHARPTTSERMAAVVQKALNHADAALDRGEAVGPSTERFVLERIDETYQRARTIGENVVDLLPKKGYNPDTMLCGVADRVYIAGLPGARQGCVADLPRDAAVFAGRTADG